MAADGRVYTPCCFPKTTGRCLSFFLLLLLLLDVSFSSSSLDEEDDKDNATETGTTVLGEERDMGCVIEGDNDRGLIVATVVVVQA